MPVSVLERVLTRRSTVYGACAVSLVVGLFFIFVWAPHPWGREGFDHYHQLALTLGRGLPFPTLDYPWGYAYFLAAFYRVFGDRPLIPLTAQAIFNAGVPALVFEIARDWLDRPTATVAAILTGMFSFNTIYASTQSSDAMCTVIFLASVLALIRGIRGRDWRWIVLAGALAGIAPQFRPNLILIPVLFAGWVLWTSGRAERAGHAAILLLFPAILLAPWVVRNYRLTRTLLPTTAHGGIQLWYGTLQTGQYLTSRAYNPRAVFETPTFEYTSLDWLPLIVSARVKGCAADPLQSASVVYWSDRDTTHRQSAGRVAGRAVFFEIPSPAAPSVVYYYLTATWTTGGGAVVRSTPTAGASSPLVYFVSDDHLGDRDLHGDLLDPFDVIRIMRRRAWGEPLPFAERLAAAGFGSLDLEAPLRALKRRRDERADGPLVAGFTSDDREARLTLSDGSTIVVPRAWRGRITDLGIHGQLAGALLSSTVRLSAVHERPSHGNAPVLPPCGELEEIAVNEVFYRSEPHLMRRYFALALDNIDRAPVAFALATLYRAGRLFIVRGTTDRYTSQQFEQGGRVNSLATAASVLSVALFLCGVALGWRKRLDLLLPLLLIVYVPVTIAPMLTNMRYTVTVQPLMFMFAALAVTAALRRLEWIA
jgi:dolichyl-phosphate-mannose-protein mannosyltransferase